MKKLVLTVIAIIFCTVISRPQAQDRGTSVARNPETSASKISNDIQLQSGTQLLAQLQSAVDVRKVKEGDEVILKTTKDLKAPGEVIIKKGATIVGHVTQVQKKSKDRDYSSLSLVFDKLENGSMIMPLDATLTSITQAAANTSLGLDRFDTSGNARSRSTISTPSQGSGGLLGGVTDAVGGIVNTTTQTVGGVLNTTTDSVGKTTGAVSNTLSGIKISQATNATAEVGTTITQEGNNIRLEKGISFLLLLNSESKAETKANQKDAKKVPEDHQ